MTAGERAALQISAAMQILVEALESVSKWFGEFPETGEHYPNGEPMSYGVAFGSNGERDFMRAKAKLTLEMAAEILGRENDNH